jgi:predicted DNA binding CopG/RHH family protein
MATRTTKAQKPKPRGRPKVSELRERVTFRLKPSEYEAFKRIADSMGIPVQIWMRLALVRAARAEGATDV